MYRMVFTIGVLAHLLTRFVAAKYNNTTVVLPAYGNVYPDGYYFVKIKIGDPSAEYTLRIDSRTDLTWVRCGKDAGKTNPAYQNLPKLIPNITLPCMHQICVSLQAGEIPNCGIRDRSCRYAESSKSTGLLCLDTVDLGFTKKGEPEKRLTIGCGQHPTYVNGILGIGKGNAGILHQLQSSGVMDNIFGHCFTAESGGYLIFGAIPRTDIVWLPKQNSAKYKNGSDLYIGNEIVGPFSNHILLYFDSGSPYTYFSSQVYAELLTHIKADLGNLSNSTKDDPRSQLPVCWNVTALQSNNTDAYAHFKPLNFLFANDKASNFTMDPSSYLILLSKTTLCLGILDGGSIGMGNELGVIGEIAMLNKWIVYDNNDDKVGWASADCTKPPVF